MGRDSGCPVSTTAPGEREMGFAMRPAPISSMTWTWWTPAVVRMAVTLAVAGPAALRGADLPPDLEAVADPALPPLEHLAEGSAEAQKRQVDAARALGLPLEVRSVRSGIVFRLIPPGRFVMGTPLRDRNTAVEMGFAADRADQEMPPTRVVMPRPYYLAVFPVTYRQWEAVMGDPAAIRGSPGPDEPAGGMDLDQIAVFLDRLSRLEGAPPDTYRLPSEAEWEYGVRAGTSGLFAGDPEHLGWFGEGIQAALRPVGGRGANAWGIRETMGGVEEWVADEFAPYPGGVVGDRFVPRTEIWGVARGSFWTRPIQEHRPAARIRSGPLRRATRGFRIVREAPGAPRPWWVDPGPTAD